MYLNGTDNIEKNEIKAFKLLSFPAPGIKSRFLLTNLYINGVGTPKNHEKAKETLLLVLRTKHITAKQKEQAQKSLTLIDDNF